MVNDKSVVDQAYGEIALQVAKLDIKRKGILEQAYKLGREMSEKEVERRELSNARIKASASIKVLTIQIENLKQEYFNTRA